MGDTSESGASDSEYYDTNEVVPVERRRRSAKQSLLAAFPESLPPDGSGPFGSSSRDTTTKEDFSYVFGGQPYRHVYTILRIIFWRLKWKIRSKLSVLFSNLGKASSVFYLSANLTIHIGRLEAFFKGLACTRCSILLLFLCILMCRQANDV